jgi:hypothetical protein
MYLFDSSREEDIFKLVEENVLDDVIDIVFFAPLWSNPISAPAYIPSLHFMIWLLV